MFEEFRVLKLKEIAKDYKFIIEHILPEAFLKDTKTNQIYLKSVFMRKDKTKKYKFLKKLYFIIEDSGRIYLTDKSYQILVKNHNKEVNLTNFLINIINNSINKNLFIKILDCSEY